MSKEVKIKKVGPLRTYCDDQNEYCHLQVSSEFAEKVDDYTKNLSEKELQDLGLDRPMEGWTHYGWFEYTLLFMRPLSPGKMRYVK